MKSVADIAVVYYKNGSWTADYIQKLHDGGMLTDEEVNTILGNNTENTEVIG